jgi:hypothetical protein
MKSLPSVSLYIRITDEKGRRYERIRRRNPQICGPREVYCVHFYEKGRRKWLSVGTDLSVANAALTEVTTSRIERIKADRWNAQTVADQLGRLEISGPVWR